MVYDPHERLPVKAVVTPDNVNDITVAQRLSIEPGATYTICDSFWIPGEAERRFILAN